MTKDTEDTVENLSVIWQNPIAITRNPLHIDMVWFLSDGLSCRVVRHLSQVQDHGFVSPPSDKIQSLNPTDKI